MFVPLLALGLCALSPFALSPTAHAAPAAESPAESPSESPAESTSHLDLEQLYTQGQFEEGLKLARQQLDASPQDVDLHWHVARFYYEVGERVGKDAAPFDKEEHYSEMLDVTERGLALSPGHPHLLFGKGIALGRLGTTRGLLASIRMASDIEDAWAVAADSPYDYHSLGNEEVLPCDAYMALGTFYRMVPEWWIVKVLAGTRGDLDAAVSWIEKADQCSPGRVEIKKELGVAQICRGQKRKEPVQVDQGVALLTEVAKMPPTKPTDAIDVTHAAMVAADPDMACEYSRDGQADLDRKKLDEKGARR